MAAECVGGAGGRSGGRRRHASATGRLRFTVRRICWSYAHRAPHIQPYEPRPTKCTETIGDRVK